MFYLKKFETNNSRTQYEGGGEYIEPYVSLVKEDDTSHYNKPYLCKLTLQDGSKVKLYGSGELTSAMTSSYKSTLVSAEIGELCTSIGSNALDGCRSLTSVTIGNSVTSIGSRAFRICTGLTNVTIPSSVTSIGDIVFYYCTSLTSVTIPNGITSIGVYALGECGSLTSIDIPSSVTSIGDNAFVNCRGLTSVTVNATTPPTLGTTAFNNTNDCPIYVPSASVETYKAANNWSTYASRIQAIQ